MLEKLTEILGEYITTFWGQRLVVAAKRGSFNEEDVTLSVSWATCACGKLTQPIARKDNNVPKDATLTIAGVKFANIIELTAMDRPRFLEAARLLVAIEDRAKYLTQPRGPREQDIQLRTERL